MRCEEISQAGGQSAAYLRFEFASDFAVIPPRPDAKEGGRVWPLLLSFGEEQTQIAQVVSGGAGHDCVIKPGEKGVSVALAEGGGGV